MRPAAARGPTDTNDAQTSLSILVPDQVTVIFALVSAVVVAAFAVMTVTAGHLQSTDHQRSGSTRAVIAGNQRLATSLRAATTGDARAHRLALAISAAVSGQVSHWAAPVIHTAQTNLAAARRMEAPGPPHAGLGRPEAPAASATWRVPRPRPASC
jgi:hypothetical protein